MSYNIEVISPRIWKIVESDPYGQYPFLYVIMGADKCVLIDTGCGTGDYRTFVTQKINIRNLPYLVICTHVHFDHVGGNFRFCGANAHGCQGICMGCNDEKFSANYEINSLSMAHNCKVRDFTVSRWLKEGDLIPLDDTKPEKANSLEIIFTPGHTSDSIAIYSHGDKRLFVGDTLYPFTAIHLDCISSNVSQYIASLKKLQTFVERIQEEKPGASLAPVLVPAPAAAPSPAPAAPAEDPRSKTAVEGFLQIVGLTAGEASKQFNVRALLELCDYSVENAVDLFLSSPDDAKAMCPPLATPTAASPAPSGSVSRLASSIMMSCGHVEANLPTSALREVLDGLSLIQAKAIPPSHIDSGYGEYSVGNFTIMMSITNNKW